MVTDGQTKKQRTEDGDIGLLDGQSHHHGISDGPTGLENGFLVNGTVE